MRHRLNWLMFVALIGVCIVGILSAAQGNTMFAIRCIAIMGADLYAMRLNHASTDEPATPS